MNHTRIPQSGRVDLGYEAHNDALRQFGKIVSRQPQFVGIRMKKLRDPQLVIVRNKITKEVVDLEVRNCYISVFIFTLRILSPILRSFRSVSQQCS